MAKEHLRNILLCVIVQALSRSHAMKTSLEVAVEGDRIEIECTTNSSLGVDWKFSNATKQLYELSPEGVVPDLFKMDYSVTNVNYSSYTISNLTIARVKKSNVGTYFCVNGENHQQILSSVDLALLTIPICEPDTNSTETMRRYVCNFTSAGNISSRSEWIEDFCTNSTPTVCSDANEGNIYCEFPINRKNRTFLPFATNLTSHGIEVCEISCRNWKEASTDGFRNTSLNMSVQISVLLQCSVNPNLTTTIAIASTTPARSYEPRIIEPELYLYGSIAASVTGVLLTIIIIAVFRNTNACSSKGKLRYEDNNIIQQSAGEQIGDYSYYHELEAPYAEIALEPTESHAQYTNFGHESVSTENTVVVDNSRPTQDSVPTSPNSVGSSMNLENHNLLTNTSMIAFPDTAEKAAAVVYPEYADPHDLVSSLPYAEVYQKKPNA